MDSKQLAEDVFRNGFAVARQVLDATAILRLQLLCRETSSEHEVRRKGKDLYGVRQLLQTVPDVLRFLQSAPLVDVAQAVLGPGARPVKGTFFDKTLDANWPVPWHQDVTITVRERRNVPGYEMRPVRDGAVHVIPPVEVSEQLLTLRIHLDAAGSDHGALRVIPGSHRFGRLNADDVQNLVTKGPIEIIEVEAGDVMLMRPLLLHASSPCEKPDHRRVIHVEYSAMDLPGGLVWAG
jgi:hypothetical protein